MEAKSVVIQLLQIEPKFSGAYFCRKSTKCLKFYHIEKLSISGMLGMTNSVMCTYRSKLLILWKYLLDGSGRPVYWRDSANTR